MLIEFRVENHRSIRDEQVLTMEAGRVGSESDVRPRGVDGHSKKLLPCAVLYGANASGKSNVLSSLAFMREAVVHSQRSWDSESGVPRSPFAWGEKHVQPSAFEITFVNDGTKYEYGFVVNDLEVEEEWLHAWPNGRKQVWFERDSENFKFGENLQGPNEVMRDVTRPNALFLSVATQHKHPQLSSVYAWFRSITPVNVQGRGSGSFFSPYSRFYPGFGRVAQQFLLFEDEPIDLVNARIRDLLKAADTGIVDVKVVTEEPGEQKQRVLLDRILLKHKQDDDESWLDLNEESQGTRTLFRMATPLFRALSMGGVLLIDELESSLHPLLGLSIVKMFNCPKTNWRNAQIIFTTHDTNLLGPTMGEPPMRRDQIWFTEKDAEGASRLYPLTDFKPRGSENLERGYLQGRYGAIPFLGDIGRITEHN